MVAVICAPTHCKFTQITRSDKQAVVLVCYIEQNLCAFSRLGVFVCYILDRLVMLNIFHMLNAGVLYADFFYRNAERFHQIYCVIICSVGCAETRHCYAENIA